MATIPLTLHGITWCWRHGHPIVGLQASPDQVFWVTLSPDDAQALSPMYQGHNTGRSRVYELLESTLECLGTRIADICLGVGSGGSLCASLTIDGMLGPVTRPVHVVDAIVLAHRGHLTIGIDESHLRGICHADGPDPHHLPGDGYDAAETPESFRAFIESLDLGQLDCSDDI